MTLEQAYDFYNRTGTGLILKHGIVYIEHHIYKN